MDKNDSLKEELKKIEIPEELHERSRIGIAQAKKEMIKSRKKINLRRIGIVAGLMLAFAFVFLVFYKDMFDVVKEAENSPQESPNESEALSVVYFADYPYYEDFQALVENSDLIIRGKVLDSTVQLIDVSGPPLTDEELKDEKLNPHLDGERAEEEFIELVYTVSELEIEEVYKGTYDDEIIQVKQGGGQIGDVLYIEQDVEMLAISQSYILFLKTFDTVPASLLNPYQAAYVYTDGDIESFHPGNNISLDEEKLQTLKEKFQNK